MIPLEDRPLLANAFYEKRGGMYHVKVRVFWKDQTTSDFLIFSYYSERMADLAVRFVDMAVNRDGHDPIVGNVIYGE